eukprot:SAG31_NODE_4015_length_3662_cov_4.196464_3_plen_157_part_00
MITGGRQVFLCRSKDLGLTDPWVCKLMVAPTGRGGTSSGPGDGAIAPYAGFAKDARRKDFDVMAKKLDGWYGRCHLECADEHHSYLTRDCTLPSSRDWNSNDADVCCSGGSVGAFLIWGASTQGGRSNLPAGVPSFTNALGFRNDTLEGLLAAFFR